MVNAITMSYFTAGPSKDILEAGKFQRSSLDPYLGIPSGYVSVPVGKDGTTFLEAVDLSLDKRITSDYLPHMHSISRIRWTDAAIAHVARHRVHPEEVEAVCFGAEPVIRAGRNGLHYVFGQTEGGRYLFIVVREARPGEVRIVTAREMDTKERAYYRRRGK